MPEQPAPENLFSPPYNKIKTNYGRDFDTALKTLPKILRNIIELVMEEARAQEEFAYQMSDYCPTQKYFDDRAKDEDTFNKKFKMWAAAWNRSNK